MATRPGVNGTEHEVMIDPHFDGMPEVAHGGYLSGLLADALGTRDIEVRLRRPVPTGRRLTLVHSDRARVAIRDHEALLVEGVPGELSLEVPLPVPFEEAERASRGFPGLHTHPFPACLVCGPAREAGDGLRIFPGPVDGRRLVAAAWVPVSEAADQAGRVARELTLAALDCPQLWSLMVHAPSTSPDSVVTASLAARFEHPVLVGEPHVVIAWPIGRQDSAWVAGAAVVGPGGELCAIGRQTAAITSWGVPLGRDRWEPAHTSSPFARSPTQST